MVIGILWQRVNLSDKSSKLGEFSWCLTTNTMYLPGCYSWIQEFNLFSKPNLLSFLKLFLPSELAYFVNLSTLPKRCWNNNNNNNSNNHLHSCELYHRARIGVCNRLKIYTAGFQQVQTDFVLFCLSKLRKMNFPIRWVPNTRMLINSFPWKDHTPDSKFDENHFIITLLLSSKSCWSFIWDEWREDIDHVFSKIKSLAVVWVSDFFQRHDILFDLFTV